MKTRGNMDGGTSLEAEECAEEAEELCVRQVWC